MHFQSIFQKIMFLCQYKPRKLRSMTYQQQVLNSILWILLNCMWHALKYLSIVLSACKLRCFYWKLYIWRYINSFRPFAFAIAVQCFYVFSTNCMANVRPQTLVVKTKVHLIIELQICQRLTYSKKLCFSCLSCSLLSFMMSKLH